MSHNKIDKITATMFVIGGILLGIGISMYLYAIQTKCDKYIIGDECIQSSINSEPLKYLGIALMSLGSLIIFIILVYLLVPLIFEKN